MGRRKKLPTLVVSYRILIDDKIEVDKIVKPFIDKKTKYKL